MVKPVCDKTEMCGYSSHRKIIEQHCDTIISIIQVLNKCTIWKNRECQCKSSKVKWTSKVDFLKKTAKLQYKVWLDRESIKDSQLHDNAVQYKRVHKN